MRLLNTSTFKLKTFDDSRTRPRYVILSHVWNEEEVSFQDIQDQETVTSHRSYPKVNNFCKVAEKLGYHWVWDDTCCIDKSSSADLSETINAMYKFYEGADICVAYLEDVPSAALDNSHLAHFARSRWFNRGWTLQELIAPQKVVFYDKHWSTFGDKHQLVDIISQVTGIPRSVISYPPQNRLGLARHLSGLCVAQRYSWVSNRQTTREEDIAYCLMGLLKINMPILYGEGGHNAFLRLQTEFARQNHDQSMFAWSLPRGHHALNELPKFSGLFASSPQGFAGFDSGWDIVRELSYKEPHDHTNLGIRVGLNILKWPGHSSDYIACLTLIQHRDQRRNRECLGIPLTNIPSMPENGVHVLKFFRRKPYWPLAKLRYDSRNMYELLEDYSVYLSHATDADIIVPAGTILGAAQYAMMYVLEDENW